MMVNQDFAPVNYIGRVASQVHLAHGARIDRVNERRGVELMITRADVDVIDIQQ